MRSVMGYRRYRKETLERRRVPESSRVELDEKLNPKRLAYSRVNKRILAEIVEVILSKRPEIFR